jgi:hypothetical protein
MPSIQDKSIATHTPFGWDHDEGGASMLKGELLEFALADVVQFIGLCRKTGKVEVSEPGMTAPGELFFEAGELIHATAGSVVGEQAVAELLSLADGTFRFVEATDLPPRTLHFGVPQILLRAAQKCDEEDAGFEFAFEDPVEPCEPDIPKLKDEMKRIVARGLGRKRKKALAAIDSAEDTLQGLRDVCTRIDRYASLFVPPDVREVLAAELYGVIVTD